MFRPSVAAFYLWTRCRFDRRGSFYASRSRTYLVRLRVGFEVKKVVYRMSEILFAAEIALRRLDGCMPQQELNLLQLSTVAVAQLRAGSPQVVRRNMFQARSLAADLDDVPHNILRDTFPPYLVGSRHRSKDPSVRDLGRQRTAT